MIKIPYRHLAFLALILIAASSAFSAPLVMTVVSVGPSYLSSNQDTYEVNAEFALQNGLTTNGTVGTPGYYAASTGPIPAAAFITTTFNSWLGQVPPTGNYINEFGNAVYIGLSATASSAFDLQQVSFSGLGQSDTLTGVSFSDHTVGICLATDPLCSSATNVIYNASNPGSDTSLVDEVWTSGLYFYTVISDPSALPSTTAAFEDFTGTVSYTVPNAGTGDATVASLPEPGTLALLGFGLGGILLYRRRLSAGR